MKLPTELKPFVSRGFDVQWTVTLLASGEAQVELPISSGDITDEADADVRRRCNLVVPGLHEWIPSNARDYLWPVGGYEVFLTAVMKFLGGRVSTDPLPLGVYRITKPRVTLSSGGDRAIAFEGYDRSLTVSRNKLRAGQTLLQGTSALEIVKNIVEPRLPPQVQFNFPEESDDNDLLYTLQWDMGDNPWSRCVTLMRSLGYDLYFDGTGTCTIEEIADPIGREPDFIHTTGDTAEILYSDRDRATVKSAEWSVDDEDTYNHIIVKGDNTDNDVEIFGEAWDDDPLSPTWIGGDDPTDPNFGSSPFGDKVNIIQSQSAYTRYIATRYANAELIKAIGLTENLGVRTFWLPHESNDIVKFIIPEIEVEQTYVLDGLKQVLAPEGDLDMATRQRRVSGVTT